MRIGVFGDSYADVIGNINPNSWPALIKTELNAEVDYHATSGTSMWWAYQTFKKNFKKYDTIIFSFTSANRWPSLPSECSVGEQYNIGYVKTNNIQDKLNPLFPSLFPDALLSFINSSIHRDVVESCIHENKYLIQLIPFLSLHNTKRYDFDLYPNQFPIISAIDKVSHKEEIEINGIRKNTCKYIFNKNFNEYRTCHLNNANNKIVADWIIDCVKNIKYNEQFECEKYNNWVFYDPTDSNFII